MRYAPHKWRRWQFTDTMAAERSKRYRDKRDGHGSVTRDDRGGNGCVTDLEQKEKEKNRDATVTVEVTDPAALAAWGAHGKATKGRPYPRNRRGSWHFPTKWPPGHGAEIHAIATGRKS
jgi:hypothetical protein